MKSKILALGASALLAVAAISPAAAQSTKLPGLAGPSAPAGQTLTHANGYAFTVPSDWLMAADVNGADFVAATPDGAVFCATFSEGNLPMESSDEELKAALGAVDLGADFFSKNLFGTPPDLAFESTGPQPDHPSGWPFQRAVATFTVDGVKTTALGYATFKSKTFFAGFCYSESAKIGTTKAVMDGVINAIKITK